MDVNGQLKSDMSNNGRESQLELCLAKNTVNPNYYVPDVNFSR